MSRRTVFTTLTPLPSRISRQTILEALHSHTDMIDLNPLVEERHQIKPPPEAIAEEYYCVWYSITDRVSYLPGRLVTGKVTYSACFHDLTDGVQIHSYAPMGVNIKGTWTIGGSLPGEPVAPQELGLGAPPSGLYLREDVDMKCNVMMKSFVKKTLKKGHSTLVDRILDKAQTEEADQNNLRINDKTVNPQNHFTGSQASTECYPGPGAEFRNNQSMTGDTRNLCHNAVAPQIPPSQSSPPFSIRGLENPEVRSQTHDDSGYKRAPSEGSSTSSYNGSLNGGSLIDSQGRISYQDLPSHGFSWQNSTWENIPPPSRTPPAPQNAEIAFRQQPQPHSDHFSHADLDTTHTAQQTTYSAQARYGSAELE